MACQLAKESGAKVTAITVTDPYRAAAMDAVLIPVDAGGIRRGSRAACPSGRWSR